VRLIIKLFNLAQRAIYVK